MSSSSDAISRQLDGIEAHLNTLKRLVQQSSQNQRRGPPMLGRTTTTTASGAAANGSLASRRPRPPADMGAADGVMESIDADTGMAVGELMRLEASVIDAAFDFVRQNIAQTPPAMRNTRAVDTVNDRRYRELQSQSRAVLSAARDAIAAHEARQSSAMRHDDDDARPCEVSAPTAAPVHSPISAVLRESADDVERERQSEKLYIAAQMREVLEVQAEMARLVDQQGAQLSTVEQNVTAADANVTQASRELSVAGRLAVTGFALTGGIAGAVIAGPVGMVAGLKSASAIGAAAVLGGLAGAMGTKAVAESVQRSQAQDISPSRPTGQDETSGLVVDALA